MIDALRGDDLLIALRELPAYRVNLVTIAAAGAGFDGNLTSDSTRTRGVVLSSDIAPTVLERFGIPVPAEMNGHAIRTQGERDVRAVESLEDRLIGRPSRTLVVLVPLEAWLALAALATLLFGSRGARRALPLVALSCVWGPAMLLLGAAIRPDEPVEALIVALGSPALAALTLAALPAYAALALSCAVVVGAHAIDVVAGSPLTSLSVLGPNPGGGVRFFGIGNELEATLTTLTLIGAGAGLAALRVESGRRVAAGFAAAAFVAALAFAPGHFGADVGAAIVLGAGGAVAAALALRLDGRLVALGAVAVPALALGALVAIDSVVGGGAHLTDSVLGAGSSGELSDVLERRLRLTARSFTHPIYPELLAISTVLLATGVWQRRRVLSWFGDRRQARCGYLGALTGVLVGTVANDSGTMLLTIGTIYLAVCAGFFWATGAGTPRSPTMSHAPAGTSS
jgi:hypothetical protein